MATYKSFVGFCATGFVHGGGTCFVGVPRASFDEAWADAQKLSKKTSYGDTAAGVFPSEEESVSVDHAPVGMEGYEYRQKTGK